jgi:hypothetical protein
LFIECPGKKIWSQSFAGHADQSFHVVQIFFQSATARSRQTILSLGHASVEGLGASKIACIFQLARVNAEVAVGGAYQLFELIESERFIYRERADDCEPRALMNQPVEMGCCIFRLARAC